MPARPSLRHALAGFLAICLLLILVACGGGSNTTTSPPLGGASIVIQILQGNSIVAQGAMLTFGANVSGTTNSAVTWSVQEGGAGGSITSAGVYTAPMAAGTYHVIATSVADSSKSATVTVTVQPVSVSVSPNDISMGSGEALTFTASVSGCVSFAVNWSIQEGAAGGTITAAGVYTAPAIFGTYHVVATSTACTSTTNSAVVSVAPLSVTIAPTSDVLGPAGMRNFSATVLGSRTTGVTWTITEGAAGGSITSNGAYTAPTSTGIFHVVAATVKDPTTTSTATVTAVASGFRPTGNMQDSRSAPTATLLKSGKVLISGGAACLFYYYYYYGSCVLASGEIYDPVAGTFSKTVPMATFRVFHTATLLPGGLVLVAGGTTRAPSAELFDEGKGTFTATGAMAASRDSHTATLLPNQHVLIVGGKNSIGPLTSSEDYDSTKGTFTSSGNMVTARAEHTATLLANGKVLIAGGASGHTALSSAELYDPATGMFTATGNMNAARSGHTATLLTNGNVLITGGTNGTSSLESAEIYDVPTGKFTMIAASMMVARDGHFAVTLTNSTILIAGGTGSGFVAEIYDPTTQTFLQTGSMSQERIFAGALLLPDGRVLVAGGSDINTAEVYK